MQTDTGSGERRVAARAGGATASPRERILLAMAELVSRRGYHDTSVELILRRAGVARNTFYANFKSREDCLLSCMDEAAAEVSRRVAAATAAESEWPERVRAALAAFLDCVAARPAVARAFLLEAVSAGPAAVERYERTLQGFAPLLREGREHAASGEDLPPILEDSVLGGVVWMVRQRLQNRDSKDLHELLPSMVKFALTPYLGEEATSFSSGDEAAAAKLPFDPLGIPAAPVATARFEHDPATSGVKMRPLYGGRHNIPPELVARDQRGRLLVAVSSTVAERGYNSTTIAEISSVASVSRQTFYEHFASKEDCFRAAFEEAMARLLAELAEAAAAEALWPDQVAAGIVATLCFLSANPEVARLCFVEATAARAATGEQRQREVERFVSFLSMGRSRGSGEGVASDDAVFGGLVAILARRIRGGEAERLLDLASGLVEWVLSPYVGSEAARETAVRHCPS